MNVKVFSINNKLLYQYFDVPVEIDYIEGKVTILDNTTLYENSYNITFNEIPIISSPEFFYKKFLISQDEKEIIIYSRNMV